MNLLIAADYQRRVCSDQCFRYGPLPLQEGEDVWTRRGSYRGYDMPKQKKRIDGGAAGD